MARHFGLVQQPSFSAVTTFHRLSKCQVMKRSLFFDQAHWCHVLATATEDVVGQREQARRREDDDGPVEVCRPIWAACQRTRRKEREQEDHREEGERDAIDQATPAA